MANLRHLFFAVIAVFFASALLMFAGDDEKRLSLVFQHYNGNCEAIPVSSIDSITFGSNSINVATWKSGTFSLAYSNMTVLPTTDTLTICYDNDRVSISNPSIEQVTVKSQGCQVRIDSHATDPLTIVLSGSTPDGSLELYSDSACTLVLDGVDLQSTDRPAIYSGLGKKVTIQLTEGTDNYLSDNQFCVDTLTNANGCLSTLGRLDIEGQGWLTVTGNHKHAIYSKKDIRLKRGSICVNHSISDAIHSGKSVELTGSAVEIDGVGQDAIDCSENFSMTSGTLQMNITVDTSKGIKCKKNMTLSGGKINAKASGGLYDMWGDYTYCTILKADSSIQITDSARVNLEHSGTCGRCISSNGTFTLRDAEVNLKVSGDGILVFDYYGFDDYLTPKCMAVDSTTYLESGTLEMHSTGKGGKGIVANNQCIIGETGTQGPNITVSTTGESIVNSVEEDRREGSPKAIKVEGRLTINSGFITTSSTGMGGEGIECLDTMVVNGGNIECVCYDDGINVSKNITINGGTIYCYSEDNDGIDSNGSIKVNGGIVTAESNNSINESFDSDRGRLKLNGGTIFGLDMNGVDFGSQTAQPYYSTTNLSEVQFVYKSDIPVSKGKRYYITDADRHVIMSMLSSITTTDAFFTVSSPEFNTEQDLYIYEGAEEVDTFSTTSHFDGRFISGGSLPDGAVVIKAFRPTCETNY